MKKLLIALSFFFLYGSAFSQSVQKKDSLPNMLIITAHPDDWEIEMAGTAYLLKDKYHIHVIVASKGERGLSKEPSAETAAIRVKEAECAAAKINATLHFLGKIDGEIYADKEGVDKLVDLINTINPAITFILWPIDKPDHAAASNMAMIALKKTELYDDHEVYFFDAGIGRSTNHFDPVVYVNITSVWNTKVEIIRCHACQNTDDKAVKMVEAVNRFFGADNRTEYAEGFIPAFPLTNSRWNTSKRIKCSLLGL